MNIKKLLKAPITHICHYFLYIHITYFIICLYIFRVYIFKKYLDFARYMYLDLIA